MCVLRTSSFPTTQGYELHTVQIEVGHFQQEMHQTTRSGEDNVGVLLQHFELRLDRLATHDDARLKRGEVGQLLAHVV